VATISNQSAQHRPASSIREFIFSSWLAGIGCENDADADKKWWERAGISGAEAFRLESSKRAAARVARKNSGGARCISERLF
jgi:hypothetical protein